MVDISLSHKFIKVKHDIFICGELYPNIKSTLLLNVSYDRVEFKILFCLGRLHHFEAHWTFAFIVKFDLLTINVAQ